MPIPRVHNVCELLSPQDTGVSVRKRVIKILRDICVLQPEFPKVNEICIRIIRRITDEEGIKVKASPLYGHVLYTLVNGKQILLFEWCVLGFSLIRRCICHSLKIN